MVSRVTETNTKLGTNHGDAMHVIGTEDVTLDVHVVLDVCVVSIVRKAMAARPEK